MVAPSTSQRLGRFCPSLSTQRILAMLQPEAYLDDAGTHGGSVVAVLAGYVGPVSEWEQLETKWNAFLEREHLPFYHSVDSAHQREHFDGRTPEACNLLHREAVEMITARQLVAVGAGVRIEGFIKREEEMRLSAALAAPHVKFTPLPKGYFYQVYHFVLQYLGSYMKSQAPDEKLSVFCEDTPEVVGLTIQLHKWLVQRLESKYSPYFAGPPAFRPKEGYPQLQAADVLAYEMGLSLTRHFEEKERVSRKSWDALWEHAKKVTPGGDPFIWCQPWDDGL
jgi:hypothetical protein